MLGRQVTMKSNARHDQILVELRKKGAISLEELIERLGASAASIRRDLSKLQKQGLIRRTHGGAALIELLPMEPFRYDSLFQTRLQHRPTEKRRIGVAAAELIQEHDTVGFTAGTTTTQVARNIRNRRNLRVITNAINIAMELCNCEGLQTFAVTQLHRDINSVGDNAQIPAVSNVARHLSRSGAGGESDGVVLLDQLSSGYPHAAFLGGTMLKASLEKRVVSKGLHRQKFNQGRPTVGSADQALFLKLGKIAA